jgi:hypothetical protein
MRPGPRPSLGSAGRSPIQAKLVSYAVSTVFQRPSLHPLCVPVFCATGPASRQKLRKIAVSRTLLSRWRIHLRAPMYRPGRGRSLYLRGGHGWKNGRKARRARSGLRRGATRSRRSAGRCRAILHWSQPRTRVLPAKQSFASGNGAPPCPGSRRSGETQAGDQTTPQQIPHGLRGRQRHGPHCSPPLAAPRLAGPNPHGYNIARRGTRSSSLAIASPLLCHPSSRPEPRHPR